MKVILCDINQSLTDEWSSYFLDEPDVTVFNGDFRSLPQEYTDNYFMMCTAGNSFGIMGGGIDWVIAQTFPGVEGSVQELIVQDYYGEISVGSALYVPIKSQYVPFICVLYVPTMRAPIDIQGTDNVYNATRAALRTGQKVCSMYALMERPEPILVMPGFGGQCGRVSSTVLAASMHLAYKNHTNKNRVIDHATMIQRHREIVTVSKG